MESTMVLKNLWNIAELQDQLPWEPFREGVEIYRLYGEGAQGSAAALLRYAAGASVPHHTHQGFEHILVLSGAQTDQNGHHPNTDVVLEI
jgi:anti-sigma factor ChrR (cupin superfamily)